MMLDQKYWNDRYENLETGWDLGKVSQPLQHIIDALPDKSCSILIPGAGNAHEARYLISQGFTNITVLDIATAPLERLKKDLGRNAIQFIHEDFFDHHGSYDVILEQTFFCALDPRFRESYSKKTAQLLKNKGALTGVLFNFAQRRTEPPYGGNSDEYKLLFEPYFNLITLEPCQFSEKDRMDKELYIHFTKK